MSAAVAFVLLGPKAKLSRSGLAKHLQTWEDWPGPPEIEKKEATLCFNVDGAVAAVAIMPAPYPAEELKGPCQTSWLWPNAEEELANQQGHLIVTMIGGDSDDPIARYSRLTEIVTSVLASGEGMLGVYWGGAGLVIPRALFIEMATGMLPGQPPLPLWCDFRAWPADQESGISHGFTAGLEPLGHKELITENATEGPGELRERLMGLADYVITNGPVIEDGHTVGGDANEQIKVVFDTSPFGHDGEVMRLDYSTARGGRGKKRGWFGGRG